jgi:hypothetical protein
MEEWKLYHIIQNIDELKSKGLWSLTQIRKQLPPPRKKVHWDYLLDEMNWMAVDFIEERRWKLAVAHHIAKTIEALHLTHDKTLSRIKNVKGSENSLPFTQSNLIFLFFQSNLVVTKTSNRVTAPSLEKLNDASLETK